MNEDGRTTRRGLLAGMGVGLASIAGCAGMELPWEEEPEYDKGELSMLSDRSVPTIPDPLDIEVADGLVQEYRSRAQDMLEDVPAEPEIPNEMVEAELLEDRKRKGDHLESQLEGESELDRLSHARYRLASAAEMRAAYRAAKGQLDLDSVRRERHRLRGDLYDFLESWDYRGPGPLESLVFHRHIERMVEEARRGTQPGEALPDEPTTAPFQVGAIVGEIVRGRAAIESAEAVRQQFIAGLDPPESYRTAIISRAHQADFVFRESGHELDRYFEEHGDREIEGAGTPAEYLFHEAWVTVDRDLSGIERLRTRDRFAQAVLESGQLIATRRASRNAIDTVKEGELPPPASAAEVQDEFEAAIAKMESAMSASPSTISLALAWPAREFLTDGLRWLGETDRYPRSVYRAMANFRYSQLYASGVPRAARTVASWFGE